MFDFVTFDLLNPFKESFFFVELGVAYFTVA